MWFGHMTDNILWYQTHEPHLVWHTTGHDIISNTLGILVKCTTVSFCVSSQSYSWINKLHNSLVPKNSCMGVVFIYRPCMQHWSKCNTAAISIQVYLWCVFPWWPWMVSHCVSTLAQFDQVCECAWDHSYSYLATQICAFSTHTRHIYSMPI